MTVLYIGIGTVALPDDVVCYPFPVVYYPIPVKFIPPCAGFFLSNASAGGVVVRFAQNVRFSSDSFMAKACDSRTISQPILIIPAVATEFLKTVGRYV